MLLCGWEGEVTDVDVRSDVWLPGQLGRFAAPRNLWRFLANPVITQLNVTGV